MVKVSNESPETPTDLWMQLHASWDAQQELYIRDRERRYEVLFEFVDQVTPAPTRILDLACGPGSLAKRSLDRYPKAQVVAVDIDPVLLQIGKSALGDMQGRLRWVQADLRENDWWAYLQPNSFDLAVSSTALHWLTATELKSLYGRAASLLKADGVLLNADYFEPNPAASRPAAAIEKVDEKRQAEARTNGALSWDDWWQKVREISELGPALAERDQIFPPDSTRSQLSPTFDEHRKALAEAGFSEVQMVWQDLNEGLLVALLDTSS